MPVMNFTLLSAFNQTNNTQCSSACTDCDTRTGICRACNANFTLENGACFNANCTTLYCDKCNPEGICMQCAPSFILTNNNCACQTGFEPQPLDSPEAICTCPANASCVTCSIRNCISCNDTFTCQECASPFVLTNDGFCIGCNIENCVSCSFDNFCDQCSGALQVSANGDRCVACTIPNCRKCESALSCVACDPGFFFNFDGSGCVSCALPNC